MATQEQTYPEKAERIKQGIRQMGKELPEVMSGFAKLHVAATAPNVLDTKFKELMALAIAVAVRCDGCIAFHTHDAIRAGATREEVMEALSVAVLMGGGPSAVYATYAIEAFEQYQSMA